MRLKLVCGGKGVETMKYDVFISYRRDGGEYTAKILRDRLEELGYAVFFDVESLRSGDFNTKLYSVINECRDFILILSPGALDRCKNEDDWVRQEVEHALRQEKNIVPVMLRGFDFPEDLPPAIEQLRFKNGIQANTEFFEAFIQKLQSFLRTKPPLGRRVTQNSLFRRTLPVFLALLLLAAVGLGAYAFLGRNAALYPKTAAEKSTVKELLYYIEMNIKQQDMMADSAYNVLNGAQRYITSGSVSDTALSGQFDSGRARILDLAGNISPPSDRLLDLLADSPFDSAEIIAMYDVVNLCAESWIDDIDHIRWMIGPDSPLSDSQKLEVLSCYQTALDEDMRSIAYATNETLLAITDKSALNDFLYEYMPTLTHIPLRAVSWSEDKEALASAQDECWNKQQGALRDLIAITGEHSMAVSREREALIQQYMAATGASRKQAELYMEKVVPMLLEAYDAFSPAEGDDEEMLWSKLRAFMAVQLYDGAETCVDALEALVGQSDPNAAEYLPALRAFIGNIGSTGIDYGVMVVSYYEPDGVNEVFEIGDVVIEFNGEPCRNYEEYMAEKQSLSGPDYTVGVLRRDGDGGLEKLTLALTADMPRVALNTLNGNASE